MFRHGYNSSLYYNIYLCRDKIDDLGTVIIPDTHYNWASVSEPHTCDFNATFSLYICTYIYMLYVIYHAESAIAYIVQVVYLAYTPMGVYC